MVTGFWPWFLQRVSGFLLIFLVGVHIWMTHFSGLGDVVRGHQEELVLFEIVQQRLAQGLFIFIDFSLLALVLYHGLNGMRNILLEWGPAARHAAGDDGRPVAAGCWDFHLWSLGSPGLHSLADRIALEAAQRTPLWTPLRCQ